MSVCRNKKIVIDAKDYKYDGVIYVNAILGIANADSAICKITDFDNDMVFQVKSSTLKDRFFPLVFAAPQYIHDLNCGEFENMERVIIYIDRFGKED